MIKIKMTVRDHVCLKLLVNRINVALFQGKTVYTNVYEFLKLYFTKEGYTYIHING